MSPDRTAWRPDRPVGRHATIAINEAPADSLLGLRDTSRAALYVVPALRGDRNCAAGPREAAYVLAMPPADRDESGARMTELYALRFALAVLQLHLARRIWQRDIGRLALLAVAMVAEGVTNLVPIYPHSRVWWAWIFAPLATIRLLLAVAVTVDLFGFLRNRTHPHERLAFAGLGLVVGIGGAGWHWAPANWLDTFTAARQYGLLALAFGATGMWAWTRFGRPVYEAPRLVRVELRNLGKPVSGVPQNGIPELPSIAKSAAVRSWLLWMWLAFAMSSTGAGGLARFVFRWRGQAWRTAGDAMIGLEIAMVAWWLFSLRRPLDKGILSPQQSRSSVVAGGYPAPSNLTSPPD